MPDLHKTPGFSFDAKDNSLFGNPKLEAMLVRLWDTLSLRFGKRKNVAFELLNEIVEKKSERRNILSMKAINVIRNNAPLLRLSSAACNGTAYIPTNFFVSS